jgi:hypothetical protein
VPMLGQPRRRDELPGFQRSAMVMTGQNAPAKIAVRPSKDKAADTQASASDTMNAASLTVSSNGAGPLPLV